MSNALRLIVLAFALCLVGSTAALLQTWVYRRTLERQHHVGGALNDAERAALIEYHADQQTAIVVVVGVSFAALMALALVSARRREADDPALKTVLHEIKNAEHLALAAATQGEALVRERDVRQRTEESLLLQQRLVSQTLDEKVRLGRDLHDGTIQSLYATGLVLESTRDLLQRDPAEASRRLDTALKMINDTILSVRDHIKGLSPDNVRRDSLLAVLRAVAEELRAGRDAAFDYKIDDTAALRVSTEQLTQLVPLVREAVSNALRHGQARNITLRLHEGDNAVCLLVQDDGRGFDPKAVRTGGGHGLANMQARAEGMGGRLTFTSEPGAGTRIVLTLPIASHS
jgi:signal transduction histidine kinase